MAHNLLSEKFDQISVDELGFSFDQSLGWDKLENRLDGKKWVERRWLIAAVIFLAVLFVPLTILKEATVFEKPIAEASEPVQATSSTIQEVVLDNEDEVTRVNYPETATSFLETRKTTLLVATINTPHLIPIQEKEVELTKEIKPQFAFEDISIIQASLEKPSIEKGRSVSIRAQWQTSSDELNVNYQALKIKLNEKED